MKQTTTLLKSTKKKNAAIFHEQLLNFFLLGEGNSEWFAFTIVDVVPTHCVGLISHKLYADDTQLNESFSAADFSHNIAHLEQTVSNVYHRMSSNFLSFNPSKTEFLVIAWSPKTARETESFYYSFT